MKKVFIGIFMLTIVGLFAATHFNPSKHEGDPIKKQTSTKTEVKKPERLLNTCSDLVQADLANCYGVDPSDVCCVTATNHYTIISTGYIGTFIPTSCGAGCTHICTYVNGVTLCCFTIPYDYPC